MADLYIVGLGGGEQDRARREAEREAERRRLADRYARYLVARAEVGEATARRVITALFDPCDADGGTKRQCRPPGVRADVAGGSRQLVSYLP